MKKFKYIVGIILFGLCLSVNAKVVTYERTEDNYRVPSDVVVNSHNRSAVMATPSVDESIKVYDFADLLSDSQENSLYESIIRFINKTGLDAVIVITDDNFGKVVREEAADFYDYNYFKSDGVIFFIDMEIREYAIVTTGRGQSLYNDYEIEIMLDNVYPYMANRNYYAACRSFLSDLDIYYSVQEDDYSYSGEIDLNNNGTIINGIFSAFMGACITTLVIILVMVFQCRMVRKANSSRNYLVEKTKKIDNLGEIKTGSHTSKVKIHTSSSSGSSFSSRSSGTRSSSFRSSSGRSHGGGSRRF